ncbi:hypothetical protein LCGC14_0204990 [marine sediment metagenome]|uniref:PABS domain-containing protein n=1 Tax=marine sediment metagenome TaxID=412755 RepID=A0A0F9X1S3_9ZZZZ|nr:SAM-dependent methyltransferase [Phycisphaerae bacterium]HDZ43307.1 SAM-dependent methyltransferase [Phycisphaerae bacterium]
MSPWRTRLAVALTAMAVIALELTLMRTLSLRLWHHFAYMIISVALLGFGASGTMLTLCRRRVFAAPQQWLAGAMMAMALSIPVSLLISRLIPLDVQFLAWDRTQIVYVLAVEAALLGPFFLAATALGVALMDRPQHVPGHYAANLIGSGIGAIVAVALMAVLTTGQLLTAISLAACAAAAVVVPWRRRRAAVIGIVAVLAVAAVNVWLPHRPVVSQYKTLSLLRSMPRTRIIHSAEGPLGRLDVVASPSIHHGPGLSLQYTRDLPPHVLMLIDGDELGAVYDCPQRSDWEFQDYTTAAAAYHLRDRPSALIIGAGGGAEIGLALYHHCPRIVALEMNPRVIAAMTGPLAGRGGRVYEAQNVQVLNREARGYLSAGRERFDIIQLPILEAFGASGAGLQAAQESYLYTVESLSMMLDRLSDRGVLAVTRWTKTPPRDGPRTFDTAAQMLRRRGLDPARHLAMIRSWATVTVLVSKPPLTQADADAVRAFCRERSFDVCYLPGIEAGEVNRWHVLDRPHYYEAARMLLGGDRDDYIASYPFAIDAATDDRPYFSHFFRWRSLDFIRRQAGRLGRSHLEMGYVLLLAALLQTVVLAVVLIVLPLVAGRRALAAGGRTWVVLAYFLLLGAGFMLLEMGFLQRLILYLAHPIYAAAAAIGSFLVWAGLGSLLSQRWPVAPKRVVVFAAAAVVGLGVVYVVALGPWLAMTQHLSMAVRFAIATVTVAPLAVAMGHLFPTAIRMIRPTHQALVPWAWAVNGCASVAATVAAPLLAMTIGFTRLTLLAVAAYALAALAALLLPSAPRNRP